MDDPGPRPALLPPAAVMTAGQRQAALDCGLLVDIRAHRLERRIKTPLHVTAAAWVEIGAEQRDMGWLGADRLAYSLVRAFVTEFDARAAREEQQRSGTFGFNMWLGQRMVLLVLSLTREPETGKLFSTVMLPYENWSSSQLLAS